MRTTLLTLRQRLCGHAHCSTFSRRTQSVFRIEQAEYRSTTISTKRIPTTSRLLTLFPVVSLVDNWLAQVLRTLQLEEERVPTFESDILTTSSVSGAIARRSI